MTEKTTTKPARRFARTPAATVATEPAAINGSTPAAPCPESKIAQVIKLLERDGGASLDELVAVTDWLPHTTRAALTGLKKKGHTISKTKVEEVTRYTIAKVAAE